jgi:hypothetical protein
MRSLPAWWRNIPKCGAYLSLNSGFDESAAWVMEECLTDITAAAAAAVPINLRLDIFFSILDLT